MAEPRPRPGAVLAGALVAAAALAGLYAGWRTFWFLTDDAFIAFRYVDQAMAGHGYVWNPPPFRPVEGYTSFLWVALLHGIWRLTGLAPPEVANGLSLACGAGTLALIALLVRRMALPPALDRHRLAIFALVALATLTNRTFLAWLSSGLETALFNLLVTGWVVLGLAPRARRDRPRWLAAFAAVTALLTLTRPDGLLFCLAFAALAAADGLARRAGPDPPPRGLAGPDPPPRGLAGRRLLAAAPLLAVPAHLLWRHATYGEWLPNTYFAKHTTAWPASGLRYAGSFLLEYGLWIWLALAVAAALRHRRADLRTLLRERYAALLTLGALAAHAGYYTLLIGGDHFEFRVYSQLVPLLYVSTAWLAARLLPRPAAVHGALVAVLAFGLPIPWVHWSLTRDLYDRARTYMLVVPVADHVPGLARPLAALWDDWQAWLIRHLVCARHQEHKAFFRHQVGRMPPREGRPRVPAELRPVFVWNTVGVPGWTLPEVAILDEYGLNDRVVARSEVPRPGPRLMAHARKAPPGYFECFRPNAVVRDGRLLVRPRDEPLTDAQIRACEAAPWDEASP